MGRRENSFKRKTVTRWALSYLFALLIPLLLILVASLVTLYFNSSSLTYSNEITASLVQRSFFDVLDSINQIKAEIVVDSDFQEIRTTSDLAELSSLALSYHVSDIRRLNQINSNIDELFLFNSENDWYINDQGWGKITEMAESEYLSLSQKEIDNKLLRVVDDVYIFDISHGRVLLILPMTYIKSSNPNNLSVGVVVSKETLFSSAIDNYHDVVIYSERQNSVIYNTSGNYSIGEENFSFYQARLGATFEDGSYIISVGKEKKLSLKCIVIMNRSVYFHNYYILLGVILIILLSAAIFGGVLIFRNVKKDWLMYADAMEQSGVDFSKIPINATDYAPFVDSVSDLNAQKKELNEVIFKQKTSLVESAIRKLINGDTTVTVDVLSSLGLELISLNFCVLIAESKIESVENYLARKFSQSLVIPFESEYGKSFIINTNFSTNDDLNKIYCSFLEDGILDSLSLSELHTGLETIRDCYIETISVLEYQKDHSLSFLSYDELSLKTRQNTYQYTLEENMLLQKALKEGDNEKAKMVVNRVIERNRANGVSPKTLRFLLFSISGTIIRTINSLDERYNEVIPEINFPPILQSHNFQKSLIGVEEIIDSTCYSIRAIQDSVQDSSSETFQIYKKALGYIQENCSNAMMNVSSVADALDISIAYLSRIFKKYHGINISEYITSYRLDKAKELLTEGKMVGSVVEECGFGSLRTFLRVFKNIEGVTPGQYKASVTKES